MLAQEFAYQICQSFPFPPTQEQGEAIGVFARFITSRDDRPVMLLRGSAGTGKTTLAAAVVRAMLQMQQRVVLLAPTGRAAKVFGGYAGWTAHTIHRQIYRQKSFAGDFNLSFNALTNTLFMVDEASMIANDGVPGATFGSGRLLDDLVQFVYSGHGCRLLLLGDVAQLPPVGEEESPALNAAFMRGYGLEVYEADLHEVLRQSQESGILWNATRIRDIILNECFDGLPRIRFTSFPDIENVNGNELIDSLTMSYREVGSDETMVVTRSNKRAYVYNQGIRAKVLDMEDELVRGDLLMVVKNKYLAPSQQPLPVPPPSGEGDQTEKSILTRLSPTFGLPPHLGEGRGGAAGEGLPSFLANGDRAIVRRVRREREMYGFRFVDLTLSFPDYEDYELETVAILDTLATEAPALTREQNEQLFQAVMEDYAYIPNKAERYKKMKEDPYFNALQIKYAYAVTCHKAQGGQWSHVYIDQGYMTPEMLTTDYLHWLYTALTRATDRVFLVNWPKDQTEDCL